MKKINLPVYEDEYLNTNEIINDYSFWYQIIYEGKKLDFEACSNPPC
jgi:hypothetical protein